jgi:hypothetical protein
LNTHSTPGDLSNTTRLAATRAYFLQTLSNGSAGSDLIDAIDIFLRQLSTRIALTGAADGPLSQDNIARFLRAAGQRLLGIDPKTNTVRTSGTILQIDE